MNITSARRVNRLSAHGMLIALLLAVAGCAGSMGQGTAPTGRPDIDAVAARAKIQEVDSHTVRIEINGNFRRDVTGHLPDLDYYNDLATAALLLASAAEARSRGAESFAVEVEDGMASYRGKGNGNWARNLRIHSEKLALVRFDPRSDADGRVFTPDEAVQIARRLEER